ncbi:16S rRNA (guanine(966)-N(2))-methyltransferase RsmD [candidate division KSB1 bacterium]|nr:16S rRNA (guanine(966)-N(2))-methyltransferase RsmD [candidate division KSB1 bacterium]TDI93845.1 MAG: 16S rRNA (guanine(966)-N(2))-methyltransferase RsmD [Caldithrix sp.]
MRIIAGSKKGIHLASFKNRAVRPTTDRTKEVIFNVLRNYIEGSLVLDIFSGTGSLGIEALSRGAAKAVFIDNDRNAQKILQDNLNRSGFLEFSEIITLPATHGLKKLSNANQKFDLIFADPPYKGSLAKETIQLLEHYDLIASEGWLTMEHSDKTNLVNIAENYTLQSQRRQGDTQLSFYQNV